MDSTGNREGASTMSVPTRRKILIFTMSIGDGHRVPAVSVQAALAAAHPCIDTKIVDCAVDLGMPSYEKSLVRFWHFFLVHPFLFKVLYAATRRRFRLVRIVDALSSQWMAPRLAEYLERKKPDLVFCTHCTAANIIGRLKRKNACPIPTFMLVTDAFQAHAIWTAGPVDCYLLYDSDHVDDLLAAGIRSDQIKIMDFPLRPTFERTALEGGESGGKDQAVDRRLSVTLLSGGEGLGRVEKQVRAFMDADLDIDLEVICGKNDDLRARLTRLAENHAGGKMRLMPHGYVERMHEHLAFADMTMGKSGISFTFETLFFGKPFLITQTMANESGCRDFVLRHRLGWYAPCIPEQVQIVRRIVQDRSILDEYVENCRALHITNGAPVIANFLAASVASRPPRHS